MTEHVARRNFGLWKEPNMPRLSAVLPQKMKTAWSPSSENLSPLFDLEVIFPDRFLFPAIESFFSHHELAGVPNGTGTKGAMGKYSQEIAANGGSENNKPGSRQT